MNPPRPVLLPARGLTKAEREREWQRYLADIDRYDRELREWEAAQPLNRPIVFFNSNTGSYTAITPDPLGGWRSTTFSKLWRDHDGYAPWGHFKYKTRFEAVKENMGELAKDFPSHIMTEDEVKAHNERQVAA